VIADLVTRRRRPPKNRFPLLAVDRVPEDEERRAAVVLGEVLEDRNGPLGRPVVVRERHERLGEAVPVLDRDRHAR
jgi:hypothetical protein